MKKLLAGLWIAASIESSSLAVEEKDFSSWTLAHVNAVKASEATRVCLEDGRYFYRLPAIDELQNALPSLQAMAKVFALKGVVFSGSLAPQNRAANLAIDLTTGTLQAVERSSEEILGMAVCVCKKPELAFCSDTVEAPLGNILVISQSQVANPTTKFPTWRDSTFNREWILVSSMADWNETQAACAQVGAKFVYEDDLEKVMDEFVGSPLAAEILKSANGKVWTGYGSQNSTLAFYVDLNSREHRLFSKQFRIAGLCVKD